MNADEINQRVKLALDAVVEAASKIGEAKHALKPLRLEEPRIEAKMEAIDELMKAAGEALSYISADEMQETSENREGAATRAAEGLRKAMQKARNL